MFKMIFNERGVQTLLMKPSSYENIVHIIRQIAEVFNASVDLARRTFEEPQKLREDLYLSEFWDRENTLAGRCNTRYSLMYGKEECNPTKSYEVYFTVSPLANLRIRANISIDKARETCFYWERDVQDPNELEVVRSSLFRS